MTRLLVLAAGLAATVQIASAQNTTAAKPAPVATAAAAPDLTKQPTLYVVGYAHLDTQWRWCYPQVIREFIPATLHNNFAHFEKYPNYVFNFSGSRRYQMMKEYYPADYETMKKYIKSGQWFVCGSSVDENDANVPSAESQIRHVLYGNEYSRREFGTISEEFMLPDCFGFPASLPSVLAHCGLKGFSTQKLTWNAVVPIPFKVGVWDGPDGRGVVAALDPGAYVGEVLENLANSNGWSTRIAKNAEKSGVMVDYHYYGVGDRGGAPTEKSVKMVEESIKTNGKLKVISSKADDMFKAITPDLRKKLPTYSGELQLTEHSAGSLTSATIMKRWNRKNEKLADAAERASVFAWWLGRDYPGQKLEDAWYLVLGSQMHDILPGTSHPYAYDYSQNDEVIAAGQFKDVLVDAVSSVQSQMDTTGEGQPLVIYNPVSTDRSEVVEAELPGSAAVVTVTGPDGKEVPAQVVTTKGTDETGPASTKIAFIARVPSVGFATYHAKLTKGDAAKAGRATERSIENSRYKVTFNDAGDVSSIMDKDAKRELLTAPITLQQCYEKPAQWPAWNQDWNDRVKAPMEIVGGPAQFKVLEDGPVRVAIEVVRSVGKSTFRQIVRLSEGDGAARVEFDNTIDWNARERSLRVAFPLAVANKTATWDGQTGVVERPNSHKQQFEYAGQQWMDLTDTKGDYGVTISNDCKYGSDKPNDNTLRLTLIHTPGVHNEYQDQAVQDIGRHHVSFAVQGHRGDWREGGSALHAEALNQPMRAFRVPAHAGPLGREVSLAKVNGGPVMISAIKQSEAGDHVIVRLRELDGKSAKGVRVSFNANISEAFEVDGQERRLGDVKSDGNSLLADINGYELRAYAVKLAPATTKAQAPTSTPLTLTFDTDAVSTNANRKDGAMEEGLTFPAEQFPTGTFTSDGVTFQLGDSKDGAKQALACKGQTIDLPPNHNGGRLYLLAASIGDDVTAILATDGDNRADADAITFRNWRGYVGLWDRRLWSGTVEETSFNWKNPLAGLEPGYIKDASVAWYCSHHHAAAGDQFYMFSYLFKHAIDVPAGAKQLRLPDAPNVRLFAASLVKNAAAATPASPLFDTLDAAAQEGPLVKVQGTNPKDVTALTIEPRLYYGPGSLRFTLDGSEPSAKSPEFTGSVMLYQPTTVKAAVVRDGVVGPVTTTRVDIKDTTAPSVTNITTAYMSKSLKLELSEKIGEGDVSVTFSPDVPVSGLSTAEDGKSVTVFLAQPLQPGTNYTATVSGATDLAPAKNQMKPQNVGVSVPMAAYTLDKVTPEQMGTQIKVDGLPTKGNQPWTLNLFVKPTKAPEPRTIIAGFGACKQQTAGAGRYLARFQNGVHFWAHNSDVATRTPLEVGKWQMITAAYDGKVLRLYKDAKQIGFREVSLADDASVINLAPVDPWDSKRRFEGEIRSLTIWPAAMSEDSLKALHAGAKLE
jgi:alpha-mannosidase